MGGTSGFFISDMTPRDKAKAQGLKHYFTGKPCLRGHVSERRVGNGTCCQCLLERQQTEERKAKNADYRKANADKIAARDAAYYAANADTIAAKHAAYAKANRVEIAAQKAAHYQTNRVEVAAKHAAYAKANRVEIAAQRAAYRAANADTIAAKKATYRQANAKRIAAKRAAYYKANPHLRNALKAKYRATKLRATPSWADTAVIKAIYEQASFMSKVLGEKQHVDHIIPLQGKKVCGLHVPANLQILSATDNLKKSNKLLPMYQMPEPAVE